MSPDTSSEDGLATAVLEIERHAAQAGWDQPARLFALVETARLVAREPHLADNLGDTPLTPIEQEGLPPERPLEDQLTAITWPETVHGCAALVERVVLPAATRTGASYCALRLRAHDQDESVLTGPDLVPGLLTLVQATLYDHTDTRPDGSEETHR
jgi:hypothetical protein